MEADQDGSLLDDDLLEQFTDIVDRATAAGRPLHPRPRLEVADGRRERSRAVTRAGEAPRVRVQRDLPARPPQARAWTLAHETAHVLRAQEGARPPQRGLTALAGVLAVVAVVAVAVGAYGELLAGWTGTTTQWLLPAVAGITALGMIMILTALVRREEVATDEVAAVIFGEVLSPDGVQRLLHAEGGLWLRWLPTLLRTHPRPAARRRAGLRARDTP